MPYIVKHNNNAIRKQSRSGGIFTALSDIVLDRQGVVYGCAINDQMQAEHRRATTREERDLFLGSKYVQSNMGQSFQLIASDLGSGKEVLFSGTGCQVAALIGFLDAAKISTENLTTVDIVCHGTPSPMIWDAFLKWMESKYHGRVEAVNFRNKCYGWMAHFESVKINGKWHTADYYRAMFYKHYTLRPSCYHCPYANTERKSDITIADAWGIDIHNTDFNDDKGCSFVLTNTEKGKMLFCKAMDKVIYREVPIEDFLQPNLRSPSIAPKDRNQFWTDYYESGFDAVSRKYGMNTIKGNARSYFKRILGRTKLTKCAKRVLKI